MKWIYNITLIITVFALLVMGCGCKDDTEDISVMEELSASAVEEDVVDDSIDPENFELQGTEGGKVTAGEIATKKGQAHGIDVSKWQGKIDWKAAASDGIDFAIIRIGYRAENGKLYRDSNADYNIQQAQKAGLLVGVYFFSTAINTTEAEAEAAWVGKAIEGYKISYPVVYDCEGFTNPESRMHSLTAEARTDNALAFLNHIKKLGYEGMFYGAKAELEDSSLWKISRIENEYRVWVAHYSVPTYPAVERPEYAGEYDMWQYTNRGSVKGINGNCDMVVSYFKVDEAAAKDDSATPQSAQAPKSEQELLYTDTNEQVTAKQEVNLREGPSTKYNIAGVLKSGTFITRTGIGKNGWSRLSFNGKTVYAITSYLSTEVVNVPQKDIVNGMEFTPKSDRVTAKVEVNLRTEPSTGSAVAGVLKAGEFLDRTAISQNGWSRLSLNGQTVYAVTSYLTDSVPETNLKPEGVVTEHGMEFNPVSVNVTAKEEVNLRDKPSSSGTNIVHTLKNGEYVQKVGESKSGWARLIYNGQTVYAINSFLTQ